VAAKAHDKPEETEGEYRVPREHAVPPGEQHAEQMKVARVEEHARGLPARWSERRTVEHPPCDELREEGDDRRAAERGRGGAVRRPPPAQPARHGVDRGAEQQQAVPPATERDPP